MFAISFSGVGCDGGGSAENNQNNGGNDIQAFSYDGNWTIKEDSQGCGVAGFNFYGTIITTNNNTARIDFVDRDNYFYNQSLDCEINGNNLYCSGSLTLDDTATVTYETFNLSPKDNDQNTLNGTATWIFNDNQCKGNSTLIATRTQDFDSGPTEYPTGLSPCRGITKSNFAGDARIKLSWNHVPGAQYYTVWIYEPYYQPTISADVCCYDGHCYYTHNFRQYEGLVQWRVREHNGPWSPVAQFFIAQWE